MGNEGGIQVKESGRKIERMKRGNEGREGRGGEKRGEEEGGRRMWGIS